MTAEASPCRSRPESVCSAIGAGGRLHLTLRVAMQAEDRREWSRHVRDHAAGAARAGTRVWLRDGLGALSPVPARHPMRLWLVRQNGAEPLRYETAVLPPGDFELVVRARAGREASVPVTIRGGETSVVEVDL